MSPQFYQVLHLLGVILLFFSLGGMVLRQFGGGSTGDDGRKTAGMTHGIALIILLVSGFGLLAKLQLGMPHWVWVKLGLWLLLGAMVVLVRKLPWYSKLWWLLIPVLGLIAAYLGVFKPAF